MADTDNIELERVSGDMPFDDARIILEDAGWEGGVTEMGAEQPSEPDADESGGPPDGDADDLLKKAQSAPASILLPKDSPFAEESGIPTIGDVQSIDEEAGTAQVRLHLDDEHPAVQDAVADNPDMPVDQMEFIDTVPLDAIEIDGKPLLGDDTPDLPPGSPVDSEHGAYDPLADAQAELDELDKPVKDALEGAEEMVVSPEATSDDGGIELHDGTRVVPNGDGSFKVLWSDAALESINAEGDDPPPEDYPDYESMDTAIQDYLTGGLVDPMTGDRYDDSTPEALQPAPLWSELGLDDPTVSAPEPDADEVGGPPDGDADDVHARNREHNEKAIRKARAHIPVGEDADIWLNPDQKEDPASAKDLQGRPLVGPEFDRRHARMSKAADAGFKRQMEAGSTYPRKDPAEDEFADWLVGLDADQIDTLIARAEASDEAAGPDAHEFELDKIGNAVNNIKRRRSRATPEQREWADKIDEKLDAAFDRLEEADTKRDKELVDGELSGMGLDEMSRVELRKVREHDPERADAASEELDRRYRAENVLADDERPEPLLPEEEADRQRGGENDLRSDAELSQLSSDELQAIIDGGGPNAAAARALLADREAVDYAGLNRMSSEQLHKIAMGGGPEAAAAAAILEQRAMNRKPGGGGGGGSIGPSEPQYKPSDAGPSFGARYGDDMSRKFAADVTPGESVHVPGSVGTDSDGAQGMGLWAQEQAEKLHDQANTVLEAFGVSNRSGQLEKPVVGDGSQPGARGERPEKSRKHLAAMIKLARTPEDREECKTMADEIDAGEMIPEAWTATQTDETEDELFDQLNHSDYWYINELLDQRAESFAQETFANWVEKVGGLPKYIKRIAKHLKKKGKTESHAIAIAVNVVKKMCATGDVNFPGMQQVNAKSRAEACEAVTSWETKKAAAHAMSQRGDAEPVTFSAEAGTTETFAGSPMFPMLVADTYFKGGRQIDISEEDLKQAVENFERDKADGYRIPIDYDHSFAEGRGSKAAGWIEGLRADGNKLLVSVDWTRPAQEGIANREYRYISAEFARDHETETGEPRGFAILGGGLTNRPFLRTLGEVATS